VDNDEDFCEKTPGSGKNKKPFNRLPVLQAIFQSAVMPDSGNNTTRTRCGYRTTPNLGSSRPISREEIIRLIS